MEMEPVVQSETEVKELEEVKRLRLCRRMQAVTIELCMAYIGNWRTNPAMAEGMKKQVSRICGLTERDFQREEIEQYASDEAQKEKKFSVNDGINAILGGGPYRNPSVE